MHKFMTGITLIVLGVLALLQSMGFYYFGLEFWPAVMLWFGLEILWGSLAPRWHGPSVFGVALGLFVAGFGLVRILANVGIPIALTAKDWLQVGWPILLVALGLSILFGRRHWCGWQKL